MRGSTGLDGEGWVVLKFDPLDIVGRFYLRKDARAVKHRLNEPAYVIHYGRVEDQGTRFTPIAEPLSLARRPSEFPSISPWRAPNAVEPASCKVTCSRTHGGGIFWRRAVSRSDSRSCRPMNGSKPAAARAAFASGIRARIGVHSPRKLPPNCSGSGCF